MERKNSSLRPKDNQLSLLLSPLLEATMRWTFLGLAVAMVMSSGCQCNNEKLVPSPQCEPHEETCNGVDDDCDGRIDENTSQVCSNGCDVGQRLCVAGVLQECNGRVPKPEVCNDRDDDCDGTIDNPEGVPVEFCYSGAPEDLTHAKAPCGPGILRCEHGKKVCRGSTLPVVETCNGLDDNCNGKVDDGVTDTRDLDLVFVIDNSGSMTGVIATVQQAAISFQTKYASRVDLRWAIVAAPDKNVNLGDLPRLQVNFTDPVGFSNMMIQQAATGGSVEATIDAIDLLISPANDLGLTWKAGAKKSIIIFTDEEPQSAMTTETYQTIGGKIANVPLAPLADVVVFTDFSYFPSSFQWTTALGFSHVYNIDGDLAEISANLEKLIVANSCTP